MCSKSLLHSRSTRHELLMVDRIDHGTSPRPEHCSSESLYLQDPHDDRGLTAQRHRQEYCDLNWVGQRPWERQNKTTDKSISEPTYSIIVWENNSYPISDYRIVHRCSSQRGNLRRRTKHHLWCARYDVADETQARTKLAALARILRADKHWQRDRNNDVDQSSGRLHHVFDM